MTHWHTWRTAARDPAVDGAIRNLYDALGDAVRAHAPLCWMSGRCCSFDTFEHRLYVTGLEIAWVLGQLPHEQAEHARAAVKPTGACVFQTDGLCGIHAIRPMGCRIFFCQHGTAGWQSELYEQCLSDLRALHEAHQLPYQYMEWRAGLLDATAHGLIGPSAVNA